MIELRVGRPGEEAREKELWKLAFGDDDVYIDAFFDHCYAPERMLVLLEDGVIHTMAAALPMTLRLPDGGVRSAAYLYALATHPGSQNKGFARQLLHYADYYLKEQGYDCVCTVPAEVSLHRFFESVGFYECFATRKLERMWPDVEEAVPGDRLEPVGAAEYNELRDSLLDGNFYMAYDTCWVAHQKSVSLADRGDLYRVTVGDAVGAAAMEFCNEDSVLLKELLLPAPLLERGLALFKQQFPAVRYHVRTPAFWDSLLGSYSQSFAMVKWFRPEDIPTFEPVTNGYFGLALD